MAEIRIKSAHSKKVHMSATREKHLSRHFIIPTAKGYSCPYCGADTQSRRRPVTATSPNGRIFSSGTGFTQTDKEQLMQSDSAQRAEVTNTNSTGSSKVQPTNRISRSNKQIRTQRTACGNTCFNFSRRKRLILVAAVIGECIHLLVKFTFSLSFSYACFHYHLRYNRMVLCKRPWTSARLFEQPMWSVDQSCQVRSQMKT